MYRFRNTRWNRSSAKPRAFGYTAQVHPLEQTDALAILHNTLPAGLCAFAELYLAGADPAEAAAQVGAPGQARALLSDRRTLSYLAAKAAPGLVQRDIRAATVGMLAQMSVYDPASAMGPVGWLPFGEWPPQLRMCVESVELHESGAVKRVKFTKRLDVIELLLRLTGDVGRRVSPTRAKVVFEVEEP